MVLTAIDFEASCLPRHGRSFPIEVGIADERGTRSWLIRPREEWRDWDWTAQAERLHGIGRDMLERDGTAATQVSAELTAAVRGRQLVADSTLDAGWLALLLDATSGAPCPPIVHVGDVLAALRTTDTEIESACAALSATPFRRHRAAEDARWLFGLMTALRHSAASRAAATATPADSPLFAWDAAPLAQGASAPADG